MSTEPGAERGADVTASVPLPELTDRRIDEIETALFADISRERDAKRARRGRWWIGGAAAAAVIVVAAVIAPTRRRARGRRRRRERRPMTTPSRRRPRPSRPTWAADPTRAA